MPSDMDAALQYAHGCRCLRETMLVVAKWLRTMEKLPPGERDVEVIRACYHALEECPKAGTIFKAPE